MSNALDRIERKECYDMITSFLTEVSTAVIYKQSVMYCQRLYSHWLRVNSLQVAWVIWQSLQGKEELTFTAETIRDSVVKVAEGIRTDKNGGLYVFNRGF